MYQVLKAMIIFMSGSPFVAAVAVGIAARKGALPHKF